MYRARISCCGFILSCQLWLAEKALQRAPNGSNAFIVFKSATKGAVRVPVRPGAKAADRAADGGDAELRGRPRFTQQQIEALASDRGALRQQIEALFTRRGFRWLTLFANWPELKKLAELLRKP